MSSTFLNLSLNKETSETSTEPSSSDPVIRPLTKDRSRRSKLRRAWHLCRPWLSLALILFIILIAIYTPQAVVNDYWTFDQFYCIAGVFQSAGITTIGTVDGTFDITLGFGTFSFTAVKLIDILWDVVVGRGSQVIVAWCTYRVLVGALLFSMESTAVSFDTYATTTLKSGSFSALISQFCDIFRSHKKQGKRVNSVFLLLALALLTAYTVSLPTMLSAISGYQALSDPIMPYPADSAYAGTLFPASKLSRVQFVLTDGDRVDLGKNYPVGYASQSGVSMEQSSQTGLAVIDYLYEQGFVAQADTSAVYSYEHLSYRGLLHQFSNGTGYFINETRWSPLGGYGNFKTIPKNQASSFQHAGDNASSVDIVAPTLDIEAYYFEQSQSPWSYNNVLVTWNFILANGTCQPRSDYQWGFTGTGLSAFVGATAGYLLLLWIVWYCTYRRSRSVRSPKRLGTWRAILDISAALHAQLDEEECHDMTNKQLKKAMKTRRGIVELDKEDLPPSRHQARKARKVAKRKRNGEPTIASVDSGSLSLDETDSKEKVTPMDV